MGRGRPSKKTTTFVRTGRPKSEKTVICVVYKKPTGKIYYLNTYQNFELDVIFTNRKHIPLIPDNFEIVEVGMGKSFIEKYMKEFNIKTITTQD